LRHALDDASVPFACGECADAPKRVIKIDSNFRRAIAMARCVAEEEFANQPLTVWQQNLF
jgi:hypothetical protein